MGGTIRVPLMVPQEAPVVSGARQQTRDPMLRMAPLSRPLATEYTPGMRLPVRPVVLRHHARLAVTCPASPAPLEAVEKGRARLHALGIETVVGASCARAGGLWAGTDDERARELRDFLLDPAIDGIIAGRGGVGCLRLLPLLDGLPDDTSPKWIVGRSDITALHLYFHARFGWTALSGPMVSTDMVLPDTGDAARRARAGIADAILDLTTRMIREADPFGAVDAPEARAIVCGAAEGRLFPVNLSLLCSMVGTPYLPDLRGSILVLEDIQETPQRLDRMMCQLRQSGILTGIGAIALGQFTDCVARDPAFPPTLAHEVLVDHLKAIGAPAIAGVPYGHETFFHPLPVGTLARLTTDPPGLTLIESAGRGAHEEEF